MTTPYRRAVASLLANAQLAEGPWTRAGLTERARIAFGADDPSWEKLARATLARYASRDDLSVRRLAAFLRTRDAFVLVTSPQHAPLHARSLLAAEPSMRAPRWAVPALSTPGDLARWLDLTPSDLAWLADERALERLVHDGALRHYRYTWLAKRSGGHRLLEAPKARLCAIQRKILHEILDLVPPHEAAHGFRRGRSVLTHARAHAGRAIVVRLDLTDFFPSIGAARVRALFRAIGYPDEVAHVLACLCTNVAPRVCTPPALPSNASHAEVKQRRDLLMRARTRHLPQGAPTSPAIANLCARRADVRLAAAAKRMGAIYTRYADDLVFSGDKDFARQASFFVPLAAGIAIDEGFVVNHRKTRIMSQATRQHVTGLVVNRSAHASREDYDALRALLHNCARTGLDAQNHEGHPDFFRHLEGRVAWIASGDEARKKKLAALLARIAR